MSEAWWWRKTGPYNLLFLFSIGIDKTRMRWAAARGLTEFKRAYDLNLRQKYVAGSVCGRSVLSQYAHSDLAQGIAKLIRQRSSGADTAGVRGFAGD